MRKLFKHKYLLNLLALLALLLLTLSIFVPRILEYNSAVEDKQKELQIEANGSSDNVLRFSKGYGHADWYPEHIVEIVFSIALFSSLIITKRIIFSFLFVFLFALQFFALLNLIEQAAVFPFIYFYENPIYSLIFSVVILVLSYWQTTTFHYIYCQKLQHKYSSYNLK